MENAISVLIVEDEEIWTQSLTLILNDFGYNVVNAANTVEAALAAFAADNFDLALIDINLNGLSSGIELGKIVSGLYHKPFIFVTSDRAHSLKDAAMAKPSAYLTKPVNESSLFIAIQNAINNFSNNIVADPESNDEAFSSFFVKHGNRYKKIDWKDIVYLSAGKNYISAFNAVDKCEYYIRGTLQKTMRDIIPEQMKKQFIQVNRSEVVQFSFIQEVMADEVKTQYKNFPVSESLNKELRKRMRIV